MEETPGISVSVPETSPAVHDSAVAISRFLRLQMSSRRFPASTISSSSIFAPRQANGRRRKRRDAFAAPGKPQTLAGGCLDRHAVSGNSREFGDPRAHGVAVRTDAGRLADDVDVHVR